MNIKQIFLFLAFLNFCLNTRYKCGADSIEKKPQKVQEVKDDKNKRNLENEYTPIKMYVDYNFIKNQNILSAEKLNYLKSIFDELTNYISILLSVQHYKINLNEGSIEQSCEIDSYSSEFENSLSGYDIVIFPKINETLSEYVLAQAWPCLIISSNRPVAGVVEISKDFDIYKYGASYYMKYILLHELSHVLGFSYYFFTELNLIKTIRNNGITRDYINGTKTIQKAKEHFNCKNLIGVQLENQGGLGSAMSHWESRYMLGDYMISTTYSEVSISDITLAYFEDTGFYKANYYTGGLFRYGKNQGCSFLEEDCIKNVEVETSFPNEFCNNQYGYFCGSSHLNRGDCFITQYLNIVIPGQFRYFENIQVGGLDFVDYCPVSYNYYIKELEDLHYYPYNCKYGTTVDSTYEYMGQQIGDNSICMESSLLPNSYQGILDEYYSVCYKVECDRSSKQYKVIIGDKAITCPTRGTTLQNIDGFTGKIKCPDYNIICTSERWCNELFDCINKQSLTDSSTFTFNYNKSQYLFSRLNKIISSFLLLLLIYNKL